MKVPVTGCIPVDLLKNIEEFVSSSPEFKTRSAFIEAAVTAFYKEKTEIKIKPGLYRKGTAKVKKGS